MEIEIRDFKYEDGEAVHRLISGIMNEEFPHSKEAYPLNDLSNIPHVYGNSGEAFFVAAKNGQIIGTVAIKKEDERVALLRRIFVSRKFRGQRIGLALLDHAIQFCKGHGYKEIVFRTCTKMDAAIGLCQKKGFQQRAKLEVAGLELLKFILFIGNHRSSEKSNPILNCPS